MSAHHPPPAFGGPFNAQAQYPPSSSGNNVVMPPFQYQHVQDPNVQRHGQMGISPTHFANAYSFHSNAHTSKPPIPSNGVPNTSFVGYGSAPNSSFPAPPFPPVQIPYGTFPHPAPLMHHPVTSMGLAQLPNNLPQKPPPPSGPVELPDKGSKTPTNAVAATSDLEDGELSDGESIKCSKKLKTGYPSSHPPANEVNDDRQRFRRAQSKNVKGGYRSPTANISQHSPRNYPRPKHFGQSPAQSLSADSPGPTNSTVERRENGQDSPNPWTGRDIMHSSGPSSGTRYSQKISGDIRQQSTTQDLKPSHPLASVSQPISRARREATTSNSDHSILINGNLLSDTEIATENRDRAKTALRELYLHKIGYTKLVQEGLDSSLLLELYNEMGIQVASPVLTKPNDIAPKASVNGDGLIRSDRPQLPQTNPVATTMAPSANRTTTAQIPVVPVRHDSIIKQKKNEESSERNAGDQALQNSQSSDVRRSSPKPQVAEDREPTVPKKVSLSNETQVTNTNAVPVTAVKMDTKADATMTSVSAKPPLSSLPKNPVVAKSADKALERKDYIARMLAAKAGKLMPMSKAPSPPPTSVTLGAKTTPQPPSSVDFENARTLEQRRLYIGNLARSTKENDIRALFSSYSIEEISIPFNPRTAEVVGYGFVQLSTAHEAQRAISELSGNILQGRKISCQLAHKPEEASKAVEPAAQSIPPVSHEGSRNALAEQNGSAEAKRKAQTDLARQKMEALKNRNLSLRETSGSGNIVPPAVRPESLPEIPTSGASHENLASVAQVSNYSPTTPHGSYFSPINERQPFSIPGLFMASARPIPFKNTEQPMATSSVAAQETHQATTSIQSPDSTVHSQMLSIPTTSISLSSEKRGLQFTTETLAKSANSASKVHEPRKRQRASDFIDSPPRKVNRTLGQKEDASVIIDVSEEEANDDLEDDADAMDIEQDVNIDPISTQLEHDELETGKQRAIRDLPPLTDFPARKKIPDHLAFMTPPAVQTPGKPKEPDGLKPKLKEIEQMKRRIAELEQRNKAKQTSSRAQTPGTPGHAKSPPRPAETVVEGNERPRSSAGVETPVASVQEHTQAHAKTATPSATKDTQKIIGFGEAMEHHETGKDLAVAVSQTLQLGKDITSEGQQQGQSADYDLEELRPIGVDIDQSKSAQATLVDNKVQLQPVLEPIKEIEDARAETDRLRAAEAAAAAAVRAEEHQRLIVEQRVKALPLANAEVERSRIAESATGEEEQRRRRRTDIESGLPILDAEVERTRQRLQLLRKQMEELEDEVQKGIDGRRILMDELASLSPAPSPTPKASSYEEQTLAPAGKPEITSEIEIQDSQPAIDDVHQLVLPVLSETTMATNDVEVPAATALRPSIHEMDEIGNGELAEDVMDISQSDVDEGEITDYSPDSPDLVDQTLLPESEDTYEPPLTIDPVPLHPSTSQQCGNGSPVAETDASHITRNGTQEDFEPSRDSRASSDSSPDTNESGEILAEPRSQPLNDDSDPDDYEPPEPATLVEAPTPLLSRDIDSTDTSFSPRDPNALAAIQSLPKSIMSASQDRVDSLNTEILEIDYPTVNKRDSSGKASRFTPYESPLKQFKSYRYHPNYASEVSEGFRSLTYSHAIEPDKPICRYEAAGGRCNDDSCDSQHFRSLVLSDDKVLVQMGATPAGFSLQEGEAYVTGLRQIIQEIRGRRVKDFNQVAAEISAYRARFLGDGSKVLPLGT